MWSLQAQHLGTYNWSLPTYSVRAKVRVRVKVGRWYLLTTYMTKQTEGGYRYFPPYNGDTEFFRTVISSCQCYCIELTKNVHLTCCAVRQVQYYYCC